MRQLLPIAAAFALGAISPFGVGPATAAPIDQAAWDGLKQSETPANGQRIAWVEMGPADAPPNANREGLAWAPNSGKETVWLTGPPLADYRLHM